MYRIEDPFLPWDQYEELEAAWPDYEVIARGREGNNKLFQRSAVECLGAPDIPEVWQKFINETLSGFTSKVEQWFGVKYPKDRAIRGTDFAEFYVDCQFAVNSPVTEKCRVRGPHVDNPVEAYGCCFYMRDPADKSTGGDMELYKWKGEKKFHGKAEIEDDLVSRIKTIPYKRNIAVAFTNDLHALHGVSERSVTQIPRRYINIIGEYAKPQFELPR